MSDVRGLLVDLGAEAAELDALVAGVAPEAWRTPTPAVGWTVAHQVAHLSWTDRVAALAARDPDAFAGELSVAMRDPLGFVDAVAERDAALPPAELLAMWRDGRTALAAALAEVPPGTKVPWFGPPMSAASMATARLMETWAHGQDVADGLGVTRTPTARLRHVAHIGVRTIGFAFTVHGLAAPDEPFRVELAGPDGESWEWGPPESANCVTGPALDFCLLVTQRRHPADLAVRADGPRAVEWLPIAQAFAGPPGPGRAPSGATA